MRGKQSPDYLFYQPVWSILRLFRFEQGTFIQFEKGKRSGQNGGALEKTSSLVRLTILIPGTGFLNFP